MIAQNEIDVTPEIAKEFEKECKDIARKVMELKAKVINNLIEE